MVVSWGKETECVKILRYNFNGKKKREEKKNLNIYQKNDLKFKQHTFASVHMFLTCGETATYLFNKTFTILNCGVFLFLIQRNYVKLLGLPKQKTTEWVA